jgi:DNA-binding response OmpR family regulator/Ni,Fe-hydrogenase maturation factor
MQTVTLLIDKRLELSTKYKKLLEKDSNIVIVSKDLISAIKIIKDKEPDLIIISDSFDNDLSDFCKQVRALTYNMRPIIVALSKSADFNDRIKILESGADDFLSEPVNAEEFKVRMRAHLRREFESNLDSHQLLPNKNYSMRAIKRKLSDESKWAVMYIGIENFENYKQAYTSLASDKLRQTYATIIKASLDEEDYLGELSENKFIVITDIVKVEPLARFLTFAFDSVAVKFYAEHDLDRGYMILQGDEYVGRRANFVHSTISVVTNKFTNYKDTTQVLNALVQIYRTANIPNKSNYLIERPKIEGQNSVYESVYNNKILVFEPDEALGLLLNTILNLQGYQTEVLNRYEIPTDTSSPALIIADAGNLEEQNGLDLCYELKQHDNFKNSKIIVTSIIHDKELILNTGADLYLPKPYEIPQLVKWVNEFIKEFNNGISA